MHGSHVICEVEGVGAGTCVGQEIFAGLLAVIHFLFDTRYFSALELTRQAKLGLVSEPQNSVFLSSQP